MDEPLVSVRGEAVQEVEPETAQLNVAVGARDKHREDTLRRVDERSAAVLALLESYGVERVETTSVRIGPEFKDGKPNERIAGYSAVVRHAVTVTDFAALGDLVARLAELEMVDVAGPWWRLRTDSPTYKAARMAAARDAVERGREYAEALGSRLTTVVEIADTGLLTQPADGGGDWAGGPSMPVAASPMRAMSATAAARPVSLDLEPVRQVVRASVEARFRMAAPPDGTL
ncbi:MAG TPA: SIMPL domain-containing protein [Frankiaceae bacterium]|nr:SIMPL domain-containing protein [Frankiaceae bacterium]